VKTTLQIPDAVFRRAKSRAAQQGISLRQFVTEAVEDKLRGEPWMRHVGKLNDLRKETRRITAIIEEAFEGIDTEVWG
jgi:hypothetical protein